MTGINAATGTTAIVDPATMTEILKYFAYALGLSMVVRFYYTHASRLTVNKNFADIFPILTSITFLVIHVVQSSVALSLGLLGAMSIVRFRTPIREPHELTYIFLSIAIGLAAGAGNILIPTIVTCTILLMDWVKSRFRVDSSTTQTLKIDIKSDNIAHKHAETIRAYLTDKQLAIVSVEIKKSLLRIVGHSKQFKDSDHTEIIDFCRNLDDEAECRVIKT